MKSDQDSNVPLDEKVVIVKAYGLEDVCSVLDYYRKGYTIALTIEPLESRDWTRILDMVSGAALFCNGRVRKVAETTFMLTPPGVDLIGNTSPDTQNEVFI